MRLWSWVLRWFESSTVTPLVGWNGYCRAPEAGTPAQGFPPAGQARVLWVWVQGDCTPIRLWRYRG